MLIKIKLLATFASIFLSGYSNAQSQKCSDDGSLRANITSEIHTECDRSSHDVLAAYVVRNGIVDKSPSTRFSVDDRVVLCVTNPVAAHISVWDAPPNGAPERLFPNAISHPSGANSIYLNNQERICIGEIGSGYKIDIPNSEGRGKGQFYLLATDTAEKQFAANEFRLRGFGLSASVSNEENMNVKNLVGYDEGYLVYDVR